MSGFRVRVPSIPFGQFGGQPGMPYGFYQGQYFGTQSGMNQGQPLRLGPFIGGLNIGSDVTAIADAELAMCNNFELDIDGSLVSRTPFQEVVGHDSWTERIVCLCEAIFSGTNYVIGSNANGTYYFANGTWTLITSTFRAGAALQYANVVYMVPYPGSANPGGKWDPVGNFVALAVIPQGQSAVIHKERLFVTPGIDATTNVSRLKFSDPGNFESWNAANFIDIGQGDGTNLVDQTVYRDNLLLFKNQQTYVLSYDVNPSDAVVRKISSTIGVDKQFNVVNYENQVYIFNRGWMYEVVNLDFSRINIKVPFVYDPTSPSAFAKENVFLSLVQDRLVVRYYKKIYVYGLRTRTWTEWSSTRDNLHFFGPIVTTHPSNGINEYYAGSCLSAGRNVVKFINWPTATNTEQTLSPPRNIYDKFARTVSNGWGTSDTGQVWTVSGGNGTSDFSVNGTQGQITVNSVNNNRTATFDPSVAIKDTDILLSVSCPVAITSNPAGGWATANIRTRAQANGDTYFARIAFKEGGTIGIDMNKFVGGVTTNLGGGDIGAFTVNTAYTARFQVSGSTLRVKLWNSANPEPFAWLMTVNDSVISTAGQNSIYCNTLTGNTNTSITFSFTNWYVGNAADTTTNIVCKARTKNLDMSVSNRMKRLYWWGADVTASTQVTGIATPIMISYIPTWDALKNNAWNSLNTWVQPLLTPASVTDIVATSTGTARRFIKFLKALRYRQINFEIDIVTTGTTADGPARLFTIIAISEPRQRVSKKIN